MTEVGELSAQARALIEATRDADRPTAADKARIRAKVMAATAAGAGAAAIAVSAGSKASVGATKAWLAGLAVTVGASVAAVEVLDLDLGLGVRRTERVAADQAQHRAPDLPVAPQGPTHSPTASKSRRMSKASPAEVEVAPAVDGAAADGPAAMVPGAPLSEGTPTADSAEPKDAPRVKDARPAAKSVVSRPSARPKRVEQPPELPDLELPDLAAETRLIRQLRAALRSRALEAAQQLAERHEVQFARGLLVEERLAAQVRIACGRHEADEAEMYRRRLVAIAPNSAHLAGLPTACE